MSISTNTTSYKKVNRWLLRCGTCKGTIHRESALKGDVMFVAKQVFHKTHVQCHLCHCSLESLSIFCTDEESKMNLYCSECYMIATHPKCYRCQKTLFESYVEAEGKKFHKDCFTCNRCHNPMPGGNYLLNNGVAYDEDCFYISKYKFDQMKDK